MKVGVPLSTIMLPASWYVLTRIIYPVKFKTSEETTALLASMKEELGSFQGPEVKVFCVFVFTALFWMLRTVLDDL